MSTPADTLESTTEERWVTGDNFGIRIPADPETLLAAGPEFLTSHVALDDAHAGELAGS